MKFNEKVKCVFQKELEFSTRSPIVLLEEQGGNGVQAGMSRQGLVLGMGGLKGKQACPRGKGQAAGEGAVHGIHKSTVSKKSKADPLV